MGHGQYLLQAESSLMSSREGKHSAFCLNPFFQSLGHLGEC